MAGTLSVVRLLQNPLGQQAPAGERGDLVRVSDGRARVYLLPSEFDAASPATLRWMLASQSIGNHETAAGPAVGHRGRDPREHAN